MANPATTVKRDVEVREIQFRDGIGQLLHSGQLDALLCVLPAAADPSLTTSPVLFRETCLLAVSARHRLARGTSVSLADADTVLLEDPHIPDYRADIVGGARRRPIARSWPPHRPPKRLRSGIAPARARGPLRPADSSGPVSLRWSNNHDHE
jgi:DNA-binding transcriptional LysR family regulator